MTNQNQLMDSLTARYSIPHMPWWWISIHFLLLQGTCPAFSMKFNCHLFSVKVLSKAHALLLFDDNKFVILDTGRGHHHQWGWWSYDLILNEMIFILIIFMGYLETTNINWDNDQMILWLTINTIFFMIFVFSRNNRVGAPWVLFSRALTKADKWESTALCQLIIDWNRLMVWY